jgi:hypothetical protein
LLRSQGWYSSGVSFLAEQRVWQLLDEGFDFVADPHVMVKGLLLALGLGGQSRRVVKAPVDDSGAAGKNRTGVMGIITDGDDIVEGEMFYSVQGFRLLGRNIDPGLAITWTANWSSVFGCVPAE